MSGPAPVAGVCGWPVAHSLSPLMMSVWLSEAGLAGRYMHVPARPEEFAECVRARVEEGFSGLNVTVPHKQAALELSDEASERALAVGAANLLVFREGRIRADNTDVTGLDAALQDDGGVGPAVLIGAGGAARAVMYRLTRQEREIRIVNRTTARAQALAEAFGVRAAVHQAADARALDGARLIINASVLGMKGQPPLEAALEAAAPDALVFDMVYTPLRTPLLEQAEALGLRTSDGLAMLIGQARPAFEALFGAPAPVGDSVRARLVAALEGRS
ncbi:shikimate dehydrogenase [Hyphomonadaceae bacterium ML37]|nr:shikimate dehydrogenase [Hyphomonadaceae bacterium ML37]